MQKAYASFFPKNPLDHDSAWSKIVNHAQYMRLMKLILSTKGTVLAGGSGDHKCRIAPTIVGDVKLDDPLMEECVYLIFITLQLPLNQPNREIFGPILPIVEVEDIDDAISVVADRHSPLALYVFSNDEVVKQKCTCTI